MSRQLLSRFVTKVAIGDGCWEWQASRGTGGYGQIGSGGKHGRPLGAHRVSWELFRGPIPDGMSVLHRCDNRLCVNPKHLFLGTQQDNVDDMHSKGRWRNGNRRLTADQVAEIRGKYIGDYERVRLPQGGSRRRSNVRELAAAYGVSESTIKMHVRPA